ncbi:MAG: glycosyltransferase [Lachnospiraceae bacterium]|nr:glycosyltransferase [Lachnospiraceae bacterium]
MSENGVPEKKRENFFLGLCKKVLRHPRLMLRIINFRRIKNFFAVYREEGMQGVRHHYQLIEEVEFAKLNPFAANQYEVAPVDETGGKKPADYEKLTFVQTMHPQVSIIIPVYNQFEYTYHCLASILKQSGQVSYEIIIADDCSTDLTANIEEIVEGITVLHNEENLRFLCNCNYAAKHAKGEYLLFLNNDTQVQKNWLQPLIDMMQKDESIGMTGSKLVYADGWLQEAGGIVWKDASAWNYGNRKNPDDPEYNYIKEVDYISGAAIMIRTLLWKEIGGFDMRYAPAYYEDTDLAFEVRRHGYKVVYQPLSVVIHFEGKSNGTDVNSGQKAYQIANQQKFLDKWKDVLEAEQFENGENVFLAKDRSKNKKHILVIDHYVPHYDQDAGGKCTYMYLLLLVKMGFQVTFLGDDFYKYEPYTTHLHQKGIEVLYGNYYYMNWQEWFKENLHYFDYIYMQRPHISIKYVDVIKEYGRGKLLYFAHDLHYIREYREYELTKNEEKLKSSKQWRKIEYELFEKADVGHVVGKYEQAIMQKVFPNKPIRNIPLYMYQEILTDINKDFSSRRDLIYVGGFGHAPNIDAVLWFGKEVFPKVLARYPDMKWHVVGSKVPEEIEALGNEHIVIHGFLSDEELEQLYRTCKIAVVPLRVGAGVKGKVVEAAYYQIPLVTTTIGGEGLDIEMGNLLIEDDGVQMAACICDLYVDNERLQNMSDAGARFIQRYFTEAEARRVLELDISAK